MDRIHGPDSRVHGIGTHLGSSNLRSMIRILCTERVSTHLILVVRARSDGGAVGSGRGRCGLALMVARHGRAWRLTRFHVFSSHGGRFRWGLLLRDHSDEGNLIRLTLIGEGRQRSPAMVRRLGRLRALMCAAFHDVLALRIGGKPF
jgi:hypothetical protein